VVVPAGAWARLLEPPAGSNLKTAMASAAIELTTIEVADSGVVRDVDVRGDLA
jgi:hypothetical protein